MAARDLVRETQVSAWALLDCLMHMDGLTREQIVYGNNKDLKERAQLLRDAKNILEDEYLQARKRETSDAAVTQL